MDVRGAEPLAADAADAADAAGREAPESEAPERDARERLLDAAERLYAAKGSRGMTTRGVAAEAGVNELTLYRHFTNKRGLLRAMTQRLAHVPFVERTLSEADTGDLREDLLHIARTMLPNARAMLPFILRALVEAGEHPEHLEMASARPKAALARLSAFFERRMEAGQVRRGDPTLMAHAFISMMLSRILLAPLYADVVAQPEGEVLEEFVRLFVMGVAAPAAPPREG